MAEIIKMPRLSDTMTEGVIAAWHVKVGDTVQSGDLLAEVETDKATMDVESFFEGTVLHIGVAEGDGIPVGELLTIIGEKGEDVSSIVEEFKAASKEETDQQGEVDVKDDPPSAQKVETPPVSTSSAAPAGQVAVESHAVTTLSDPAGSDGRIKASPLAKAIAKEKGINLASVQGSGDNGRIVKRDIENYKESPATGSAQAPVFTQVIAGQESFEETKVSQMRKAIARRLSDSKFNAPHFYVTMEINMDQVVSSRKSINEVAPVKISFNDIIIKAVAVALRKHPEVNSAWQGDTIRTNHHIHIGMAVAVDQGLIVPVIRFADQKGLAAISQEARALAEKARNKKLQPDEYSGNTFTVSNLGMFGVDEFTAIINSPDACILAIGGIIQKPIVKDGEIVPAHIMKVTLSCDHRVVDGATGARFLVTVKELLEDPVRILI